MIFKETQQLDLTENVGMQKKGTYTFNLPFITSQQRFIVGFSKFYFNYGKGIDHHVKRMELNIQSSLEKDNKTVIVNVYGEMSDNSNHFANEITVKLTIIALSEDEDISEETIELSAMQHFIMSFANDDHHVKGYEAYIDKIGTSGNAQIEDNSKHIGTGDASGKVISAPIEVLSSMKLEDIQFINYFKLGMNGNDHHVSHTGIEYIFDNATFDLSDNSSNHIDYSDCHVNTWKDCKKD